VLTRPRHLPEKTSDTADWETPAAAATSRLVTAVRGRSTRGGMLLAGLFFTVSAALCRIGPLVSLGETRGRGGE
jgi:hypothetical protein